MKARNAASPILLYSNAFNPALTLDVHQLINRYDMIPRYSQEMNVLIIPLDSNNPTIANWNAHRTRLLVMLGFLHIELTNEPKILPIPIDTPANAINGILEANNLKLNSPIINE